MCVHTHLRVFFFTHARGCVMGCRRRRLLCVWAALCVGLWARCVWGLTSFPLLL
jgi:hypothetical protein